MAPDSNPVPASDGGSKRPYKSPRLEVYGNIREIAATAGMSGDADGAVHGTNKTS